MTNPAAPSGWMSREKWLSLVNGIDCALCDSVADAGEVDHHGYLVADLQSCRVRLSLDQFAKGYCVLIARQHVREPHELSRADRAAFFEDMCQIGKIVEDLFGAIKINFQVLGMKTPHLHAHVIPRYYGDPAPGRVLLAGDGRRELAVNEYRQLTDKIRRALADRARELTSHAQR